AVPALRQPCHSGRALAEDALGPRRDRGPAQRVGPNDPYPAAAGGAHAEEQVAAGVGDGRGGERLPGTVAALELDARLDRSVVGRRAVQAEYARRLAAARACWGHVDRSPELPAARLGLAVGGDEARLPRDP